MSEIQANDRRAFLGLGLAGAAAGVLLTGQGADAQTASNTTAVPNMYPGINGRAFRAIQLVENTHRDTIIQLITSLGGTPRPKPNFKNLTSTNLRDFVTTSRALENTGSGAYTGAAPSIFSKQVLGAAASIALIEARHSGFLNILLNSEQTADVFGTFQIFEQPLTIQQVTNLAGPFVQDLNNGPPLTFNATPSKANDIAILNFALALEYLESDFYNINVPRFLPAS